MAFKNVSATFKISRIRRSIARILVTLLGLAIALANSTMAREPSSYSTIKTLLATNPPAIANQNSPTGQLALELTTEEEVLVKGNTAFALNLYQQLRDQEGNLFFSPFSTSTALAMTYAGARGQTATEMSNVLHFTLQPERLHPAFTSVMAKLNAKNQPGFQLNVVNRLWGQKEYGFLDSFMQLTKDFYGAGLEEVDFIGGTEETRTTINKWVEQQTQEKIQELIPPDILDPLTRLVLTNAIYFKGTWLKQFDPAQTKNQPFTVAPSQQIAVPMMHQNTAVGYGELGDLQVLELPYVGEEISMVILLPKKDEGLGELEQQLTLENLNNWLSSISHDSCPDSISIPKFKVNSEFELKEVLSAMGMVIAFQEEADFSGMNGRQELFIDAVLHKTFVDVNESGTEAAASTAVEVGLRCGGDSFSADRPFIFLIRDRQSGSILFLGRIVNPAA